MSGTQERELLKLIAEKDVEINQLRHTIGTDIMAGVVIEQEKEIQKLKDSFLMSEEARTEWLKTFDGYKLTILKLNQQVAEARKLISHFGWTSSEDTAVIRAAEQCLEKTS